MKEAPVAAAPTASIVVPTRGGASRLPRLFDALRRQSTDDFEVIVVIDGDSDDSASVVAAASDLPIRSIVFPENRGRSAALNAGFAAARGRVLIRCDDDLEPAPTYVAGHVARHCTDHPVGVIGLYRNVYRPSAFARAYGRPRDVQFRHDAYRVPRDQHWRYWAGNVSVTRSTYDAVGGYDESFRTYGWEDVDWGYRLHLAGIPVEFAPELETVHTGAAPTTPVRANKAFHSGAARAHFVAKHGTAALGTAPDGTAGAWARLVTITATICGRRALMTLGRATDAIADLLPRWIAEKAISLLVEAAAQSGHRRSRDVTTAI